MLAAVPGIRAAGLLVACMVCLGGSAGPVAAQVENARLRMQFLELQRAFPFAQVPPGALQQARQEVERRFPELLAPDRAQAAEPGEHVWQPIGPSRIESVDAGRLVAIAIDPRDTRVLYVGGAQGGVWKSMDAGQSWRALGDGECSLAMGSIALDPANPDIVYAGTGELHFSSVSYYGCGVLRSLDGGETWEQLGAALFDAGDGGARISKVIVDPLTAGSSFATTVVVSSSIGVARSIDAGHTWHVTLPGVATDMVAHPSDPRILYAALGVPSGSPTNGVYRSPDGGVSWQRLNGFPVQEVGRIALAIAPSAPSVLYAAVQDNFGGAGTDGALLGIWRSDDAGQSWQKQTATRAACGTQCWYDLVIAVHPTNAERVYFGGVSLYRSEDGGGRFVDVLNGIHVDQHALVFDPLDPDVLYAGNDGGIYRTNNNGLSWTSLNTDLAITQFYGGISMHPTDGAYLLGGTQDNGTIEYAGDPDWARVLGGDGGYTATDFLDPSITWAETQWTRNSGFSGPRRRDGAGGYVRKVDGIALDDRALFIPPLVMDATDPAVLYFGTYRLYRTSNRGELWTAVSGDLSAQGGAISVIAPARSDPATIWIGTSDGNVQLTRNGGASWAVRTAGLPIRYVRDIDVASGDPLDAILVVSGFRTGHVFRTVNGGVTWTDISGDLPDVPVNAVLRPSPDGEILIGTDLGIFRSRDGGVTWQPSNAGFPRVAVFDLAHQPATGRIVAATHGRGAFEVAAASAARVVLSQRSLEFVSLGDTATLTAQILDAQGGVIDGISPLWTSTQPAIVRVDAAGHATATGNGTAVIIAMAAGAADSATVDVRQVAVAIAGLPDTMRIIVDEVVDPGVRVVDARGATIDKVALELSAPEPAIVAFQPDGRLRGLQVGRSVILARAGTLADSAGVLVEAPATMTIDVSTLPAGVPVSSRRGTRATLFQLRLSVQGSESVRVARFGFSVTGNDRDARILLVRDLNGNGLADAGEPVLASSPAGAEGQSEREVQVHPADLVVGDDRAVPVIAALELGGRAPNGAAFAARFLPAATRTVNERSRREDRLTQPATEVSSSTITTSVLASGESFSLSENPVRSRRVVFNFASMPRHAGIFTVGGRRVANLLDRAEGLRVEWDLTNDEGTRVAPGVYLIVFDSDGLVVRERLVVVAPSLEEGTDAPHR
jgi:photosystem II stability/assembly factor-like uncharacterized protein